MLQPFNGVVLGGHSASIVHFARHRRIERVNQQGRFPATRNASNTSECAKRNIHADIFKVIATRSLQADYFFALAIFQCFAASAWHGDGFHPRQILRGQAIFGFKDFGRCAFRNNFATTRTSTRSQIHHIIGG